MAKVMVKSQNDSKDIKKQLAPNSKENIEFRKRHGITLGLFNSLADKVIQQYG
jgi:hypothetical protein